MFTNHKPSLSAKRPFLPILWVIAATFLPACGDANQPQTNQDQVEILSQQIQTAVDEINTCESADECRTLVFGCEAFAYNEQFESEAQDLRDRYQEDFSECNLIFGPSVLVCFAGRCMSN